jgi:hypothetical protein
MNKLTSKYYSAATATVLLSLAGCGSSGSAGQTGQLSLGISDGPINAKKVCIAFTEVELKGQGAPFSVDPGGIQNINLLDFQGANAAPLLFNEEIPAGDYQWLRLGVNAVNGGTGGTGDDPESALCVGDASYVTLNDNTTHNLYIPSGAESGLKLNNGITIPANATANYTAEIDLMLSMKEPIVMGADAKLRPTVRLVNNIEVGTLTGVVDNSLVPEGECVTPSVYVFDDGVMPNPIETGDIVDVDDPIATATVEVRQNNDGTMSYDYTVGFLLSGNYEAAFTCDGETFVPDVGKAANITAGNVTAVPFP